MNTENLNTDQRLAVEDLTKWASNSNSLEPAALTGAAGTGKTFVMARLVHEIESKLGIPVILTAPVHKAVEVLQERFENKKVITIHSLMQMRVVRCFKTNKSHVTPPSISTKLLKVISRRPPSSGVRGIVIIDESSLISKKIVNAVIEKLSAVKVKVLFVGDRNQLPPVGEGTSVFDILGEHQISRLTQVMRVPDTTSSLWKLNNKVVSLMNKNIIYSEESQLQSSFDGKSVIKVPYEDFNPMAFNPKDTTYIAYRNIAVDKFIKLIYEAKNWSNRDRVNYVTSNISHGIPKHCLHPSQNFSSDILTKEEVDGKQYKYVGDTLFRTNTLLPDLRAIGSAYILPQEVINRDLPPFKECSDFNDPVPLTLYYAAKERLLFPIYEESRYLQTLRKSHIRKYPEDKPILYLLESLLMTIRPRWASTVHKAQGSTYTKVLFDFVDFGASQGFLLKESPFTPNRLCYVALSRASKELQVLI